MIKLKYTILLLFLFLVNNTYVSANQTVTTFVGSGSQTLTNGNGISADFHYPGGVVFDSNDNLFVADRFNNAIRKITPDGTTTTFATGFNKPMGIAIDSSNNLYVAENTGNTVKKITPDGTITTLATGLSSPRGIAINSSGVVYVANSNANNIQEIQTDGTMSTYTPYTGEGSPYGLVFDTSDNLFVASNDNYIRKITSTGVLTTYAGDGTTTYLYNPSGLVFDSAGNIYVADYSSHRIQKVLTNGTIETYAGAYSSGGFVDGDLLTARFTNPNGIAINSSGTLFVGDEGNHRIRRIADTPPSSPSIALDELGQGETTFNFRWEDNGDAGLGYTLYRNGVAINTTISSTDVTYTDTNLISGDTYSYILKAKNSYGETNSTVLTVSTLANYVALSTPTVSQLQSAINTLPSNGVIDISEGSTLNFGSEDLLNIDKNITIKSSGNASVIFDALNSSRLISIDSSSAVILENITIQNFHNNSWSGNIIQNYGLLTLRSVTLKNNITNTPINNSGTLTVFNSIFYKNSSSGQGGAIRNTGSLTINKSAFIENNATSETGYGGAIYNDGTFSITNTTFSGNTAFKGGAIYMYSSGGMDANLSFVTIVDNHAGISQEGQGGASGGGIWNDDFTLNVKNSIIANNTDATDHGPDILGSVNLVGNNIISDTKDASITGDQNTSLLDIIVNIGLLEENNNTYIHKLEHPSLANGIGTCYDMNSILVSEDQTNTSRPSTSQCDLGAVVFTNEAPTIQNIQSITLDDENQYILDLNISDVDNDLLTLTTSISDATIATITSISTGMQMGSDIQGELNTSSGGSVSISEDGSIVAVGNRYVNASTNIKVYKYTDSNNSWNQFGSEIEGALSGSTVVSLSADGLTLAIGTPNKNSNTGQTRIYNYNGNDWMQLGGNIDGNAHYNLSGYSVSLSNDGSRIAIGASQANENAGQTKIYEYNTTSSTWEQLGEDIDGGENHYSGWSVSLSDDGKTVAIGSDESQGSIENGESVGKVRVYNYNAGTWQQLGVDIEGEVSYDYLGNSVSLSGDGLTLAVGDEYTKNQSSGRVSIYKYYNSSWNKLTQDIIGKAPNNSSGDAVALSGNGLSLVIGAPRSDIYGINSGYVSVYNLANKLTITPLENASGTATVTLNVSDGIASDVTTTFNITVIPLNAAPIFDQNASIISIAEANTMVIDYSASDVNEDTLVYSLSSTDSQLFSINDTGIITFYTIPYYSNPLDSNTDNTYELDVSVSDGSLSSTNTLFITVTPTKGTLGNDTLLGTSNNDTFNAGLGIDTIDGANGIDTAVFSGNQADYNITDNQDGSYTITGADGVDTLTNIEYISFDDNKNIDISSIASISGTPATSVYSSENYIFTPNISNINNDTLTFNISNKPSWASFDTSTGVLSGTPIQSDIGIYENIIISFTNLEINSLLPAFNITVSQRYDSVEFVEGWNYFSLASHVKLCDESEGTANNCNGEYTLESIFGSNTDIKYLIKFDSEYKEWLYWDKNDSYNDKLTKFISVDISEGLLVKTRNSTTFTFPKTRLNTSFSSLYTGKLTSGWNLVGSSHININASDLNTMLSSQGLTLKYISLLRNNIWHIYAPNNDSEVDASIPRLTSVNENENHWIFVE